MWSARLDESEARIKIANRNINNLRYAGDNTVMAESEEELKSFLVKVKEESEKPGLKLKIGQSHHFMANRRKSGSSDFYLLGFQNYCGQWLQPWN